jgi:hypothetical protein
MKGRNEGEKRNEIKKRKRSEMKGIKYKRNENNEVKGIKRMK